MFYLKTVPKGEANVLQRTDLPRPPSEGRPNEPRLEAAAGFFTSIGRLEARIGWIRSSALN